eukprot:TRINITY_DN5983_c0_g1_i5.p1 TRINITY_DN5983_c0_g1~~TRINITY_DN5983_c0_g1_i5.p1  ORF type:complete len:390 (-),score=78.57 TRINITY_DN5983_c0_g1_i5:77-1246(-)
MELIFCIQEELRISGLAEVISRYHLIAKQHKSHSNLWLLKYDQHKSPFQTRVVQECRSIILDRDNGWKVVSWPYLKFFNFGEKFSTDLDWTSAVVMEKLDGSMATLYWYNNEWHVSSTGVPDASMPFCDGGNSFSEIFWKIWESTGMNLPNDKSKCYMFEMLSMTHVIVVRPKKDEIILHGCRCMETLEELDPEIIAKKNGWPCVQTFPYSSIEALIENCRGLDPTEVEGYVVRDKFFNRVKVKTPQYVALTHLNTSNTNDLNLVHMLRIVILGEVTEFLAYFPQYNDLYLASTRIYEAISSFTNSIYEEVKKNIGEVFEKKDVMIFLERTTDINKEYRSEISDFIFSLHFNHKGNFFRSINQLSIEQLNKIMQPHVTQEEKMLLSPKK